MNFIKKKIPLLSHPNELNRLQSTSKQHHSLFKVCGPTNVALLTPQTILTVGLAWELFRPVSNCGSRGLVIPSFIIGFEMHKFIRCQRIDSLSLLSTLVA